MYYGIDLGKEERVNGIEIELGKWEEDYPRRYEVEVSSDGERWKRVETGYAGSYYWSDINVLRMGHEGEKVRIKLAEPQRSRYIRIIHTGYDRAYYWSIAEIKLF